MHAREQGALIGEQLLRGHAEHAHDIARHVRELSLSIRADPDLEHGARHGLGDVGQALLRRTRTGFGFTDVADVDDGAQ